MNCSRLIGVILTLVILGYSTHLLAAPFHTHAEINERLRSLAKKHKDVANTRLITTTTGGREVLALEVDSDGKLDKDEPVLLVHGGMHGNEWISVEVVLHLAELTLAAQSEFLGGLRFHFVPAINPDGFDEDKRKAVDAEGLRYDPNREFPVPFEANPRESKPLIMSFRKYARRGRLVGVLDYHAPAECFLWPWAFTKKRAPRGVAPLKEVVEEMARSVGYCFGQTARVISYKHKGTAQDFFARKYGAAAVLMELGRLRGPERDEAAQELVEQERPYRIFVRWLKEQVRLAQPD
jgi:murein tripeptide amidase MpaA